MTASWAYWLLINYTRWELAEFLAESLLAGKHTNKMVLAIAKSLSAGKHTNKMFLAIAESLPAGKHTNKMFLAIAESLPAGKHTIKQTSSQLENAIMTL